MFSFINIFTAIHSTEITKKENDCHILAIMFRTFGFIASKTLNYLTFHLSILSVPDEGYSRNSSCALNWISTVIIFLL